MTGDSVPDSDHVARYCAPKTIDDGKIQASAFLLKKTKNEIYLSVNWLEHLSTGRRDEQIALLQEVFRGKFERVSTSAEFAVLNAGQVRQHVADNCSECRPLTVLHQPDPKDDSHSGVFGSVGNDEFIAELLREIILSRHPAKMEPVAKPRT